MIRKMVFRSWRGRNTKSTELKPAIARDKIKFKMKRRGKKKIQWGKRREEQNMFEINYNIKTSDLICTNLKDKK